jgi:hypothetical protein
MMDTLQSVTLHSVCIIAAKCCWNCKKKLATQESKLQLHKYINESNAIEIKIDILSRASVQEEHQETIDTIFISKVQLHVDNLLPRDDTLGGLRANRHYMPSPTFGRRKNLQKRGYSMSMTRAFY